MCVCITWTRKNFHFLLDKEVFVLSINKVVRLRTKFFRRNLVKKIFFLFWHKTGKPIIVKLCCLNESNRDFIIIVTDFNEMTENFPTFSTLQNWSTVLVLSISCTYTYLCMKFNIYVILSNSLLLHTKMTKKFFNMYVIYVWCSYLFCINIINESWNMTGAYLKRNSCYVPINWIELSIDTANINCSWYLRINIGGKNSK